MQSARPTLRCVPLREVDMSYNPDIIEQECPNCAALFTYNPDYQQHMARCESEQTEQRQVEADARREAIEDPAIENNPPITHPNHEPNCNC